MPRNDRRLGVALILWLLGACGTLLFIASPILLAKVNAPLPDRDLNRLSEIGQAYGGVSAVFSGIAVFGVVAALRAQNRQIRISQAQSIRTMQIELMRMLIDDPSLRPISPSFSSGTNDAQRRRNLFTNLMLKYLEMGYEIGYFPEPAIRRELTSQFLLPDVYRFWGEAREHFRIDVVNRGATEFFEIVDSVWRDVSDRTPVPPAVDQPPASMVSRTRVPRRRYVVSVAVVASVAIAVAARFARRARTNAIDPTT